MKVTAARSKPLQCPYDPYASFNLREEKKDKEYRVRVWVRVWVTTDTSVWITPVIDEGRILLRCGRHTIDSYAHKGKAGHPLQRHQLPPCSSTLGASSGRPQYANWNQSAG